MYREHELHERCVCGGGVTVESATEKVPETRNPEIPESCLFSLAIKHLEIRLQPGAAVFVTFSTLPPRHLLPKLDTPAAAAHPAGVARTSSVSSVDVYV